MATRHLEALTELSEDIVHLAAAAQAEGYRHLLALVREFGSGANRFDQVGEGLFGVYEEQTLTAIGGVNVDPYDPAQKIGRIRRVYVRPENRRRGTGAQLVHAIELLGARQFPKIQLYTSSAAASRFYLSLGYRQVIDRVKVSHEKWLDAGSDRQS